MKYALSFLTLCGLSIVGGCALPEQTPSPLHVSQTTAARGAVTPPSLQPVRLPAAPPPPVPRAAQEVFSVVVNSVPVKTLLFALARDNKLNVDIHPSVIGRITMNATDQTLPQLLERIAAQSDIRYEINGNLLRVEPDRPYFHNYAVDYVNLQRKSSSDVSVNASLGGRGAGSASSTITSSTDNKFWDTLVSNVCQLVLVANKSRSQRDDTLEQRRLDEREERRKLAFDLTKALQAEPVASSSETSATGTSTNYKSTSVNYSRVNPSDVAQLVREIMDGNTKDAAPTAATAETETSQCGSTSGNLGGVSGSASTSNPIMVNKESGIIGVNTTSKGHERVQSFLNRAMAGARRQVLIEATIVEVQLSAASQSGINWSQIVSTGAAKGLTVNLTPSSALTSTNAATIGYNNATSVLGNISAAISLLESFGSTKVLSSPKLSVINNQTAIIKVVDSYVYVTLSYTPPQVSGTSGVIVSPAAYTSNVNTIPIGFVMTVTPQIADTGDVTLNVHPSITRVTGTVVDPNPALLNGPTPITNLIPVVQTRELESILRVQSGEIAVLGGLMQESNANTEQGIPGLNRVPVVGDLTGQRSTTRAKTELVVFMRPVVIKDPSINGDYKEYKSQLPTSTFFNGTAAEAWGAKQ
jgi:MSHA biogenesis protein MshL